MRENMKCLFVNVVNYDIIEKQVVPIGLLSLATILNEKRKHTEAKVIDLNYVYSSILEKSSCIYENINETVDYIKKEAPDFVSLYAMCNNYQYALLIASELKKQVKDITVCLAGPHASITAEETLRKYPFLDFIAMGEGELTITAIADGVANGDISSCPGIAYIKDGCIKVNNHEKLIENLDELPFLNYNLLNFRIKDHVPIDAGRGCPFNCIFCSTNKFWRQRYRVKSPLRIFKEINSLYKDYGIRNFSFEHDLFVFNRDTVIKLCNLIIDSEWKLNGDVVPE